MSSAGPSGEPSTPKPASVKGTTTRGRKLGKLLPQTPEGATNSVMSPGLAAAPVAGAGNTSGPVTEIEIKLLCDSVTIESALASDVLKRFAAGQVRQSELEATYFDTPDGIFRKNKWTLRVRRADALQSTMTLKTPCSTDGPGGIGRSEWNAHTEGGQLDLATLAGWLDKLGVNNLDTSSLQPVFQTIVCRRIRTLSTGNGVVELAADTGHVAAGALRQDICEIELELLSGLPDSIFDVAKALAAEFPLQPATGSKASRGYALALGQGVTAVKAAKPEGKPGSTLDDALHSAFQSMFAHAMANMAAAESGAEPEGVHQVRVALRRLRSLLSAADSVLPSQACAALRVEARWLMSALAPAREWDVFTHGVLREAREACASHIDFSVLDTCVQQRRRQAQEQAQTALRSARAAQFLIALGGWITRRGWRDGASTAALALLLQPADRLARTILRNNYRKVRKKGRGFRRLDAAGLHETRLALKKYRYIADVFGPFLHVAGTEHRFEQRMAQLQEAFGRYNDLHVSLDQLGCMRTDSPHRISPTLALALGAVYGWVASQEQEIIRNLYGRWTKFRRSHA